MASKRKVPNTMVEAAAKFPARPDPLRADQVQDLFASSGTKIGTAQTLGWWGTPLSYDMEQAVMVPVTWVWKVTENDDRPAKRVHISLGRNLISEREWIWIYGKTLCGLGPGYSAEAVNSTETWKAAPPLIPAGYTPRCDLPAPVRMCSKCLRAWLISQASAQAMVAELEAATAGGRDLAVLPTIRIVHAGGDMMVFGRTPENSVEEVDSGDVATEPEALDPNGEAAEEVKIDTADTTEDDEDDEP